MTITYTDSYKFAAGWNNAGSLVLLAVQPASPGIIDPEDVYAVSSDVYTNGAPYTTWTFTALTTAQYTALLATLGLTSVKSVRATVSTKINARSFANYNAVIVRPTIGTGITRKAPGWENVTFQLLSLEAL